MGAKRFSYPLLSPNTLTNSKHYFAILSQINIYKILTKTNKDAMLARLQKNKLDRFSVAQKNGTIFGPIFYSS